MNTARRGENKMSDPVFGSITMLWDWIKAAAVFLLGLAGWHIRNQSRRLGDLEKNSVSRSEMSDTLKSLHGQIQHGFDQIREDVRGVHNRIDKMKDGK